MKDLKPGYKIVVDKKKATWYIVNIETKQIQSAWYDRLTAESVVKDLNKRVRMYS